MCRQLAMIGAALVAWTATARAEDAVVTLVVDAPTSGGGTATLLSSDLPSGTPVKIQIAAPGSDPTSGSLVAWPKLGDTCVDPGSAKQRHEIGLVTSGAGDSRMLQGTLPALQLARKYCIVVNYERRLPADVLAAIAAGVADTPIDWRRVCATANPDDAVTQALDAALTTQLANYPNDVIPAPRIAQAAKTIASLFGVPAHCAKVASAETTVAAKAKEQVAAAERMKTEKFRNLCVTPPPPNPALPALPACAAPPPRIAAYPASVVDKADPQIEAIRAVVQRGDRGELSALATQLTLVEPALAASIQDLTAATVAAQRAAKLTALTGKLGAAPPQPLALYLPTDKQYLRMDALTNPDLAIANKAFASLLINLHASGPVLIAQVQAMRASDANGADTWLRLLKRLDEADRALTTATLALKDADAAADSVAGTVQAELKAIMQGDTVKALLRTTASRNVMVPSARAPATDEKASWISPTVGVLVAAPIIKQRGDTGIADGWIQPYVGASIYFNRVDRVIDLDELVGDTFWQKNSFTIGVLPNKPDVNGKDVSGPWDASIVPYVGFGHRYTQYIRADLGVIPFKYADANPIVSDRHWGLAIWVGASLDADVWALVAGKVK